MVFFVAEMLLLEVVAARFAWGRLYRAASRFRIGLSPFCLQLLAWPSRVCGGAKSCSIFITAAV